MDIKNSVLNYKRFKRLNQYDHVQRMDEQRLPRKNFEWYPRGRRRKGRPRISWMQYKRDERERERIKNLEWVDRERWRRKRKLKLQAQKDVKT